VDTVNPDLGASHYKQAKKRTLSIRLKTREKNYKDLKDIFQQPQSNNSAAEPPKKKTLADLFAQDQQNQQQQNQQQQNQETSQDQSSTTTTTVESEESLKSKACKKFRPGPFMKNR